MDLGFPSRDAQTTPLQTVQIPPFRCDVEESLTATTLVRDLGAPRTAVSIAMLGFVILSPDCTLNNLAPVSVSNCVKVCKS